MFRSNAKSVIGLALGVSLLCAAPGFSAEYVFTPRIDQRFSYDGNLRLSSVDKIESFGYVLTPGLEFQRLSDSWRVNGDVSAAFRRFEEDEFDTDDQFAAVSLGHFQPKRQLQVAVDVGRQSLRTAEEELTGVLGTSRVVRLGLRPVGFWQLNELNGLTVGASFSDVQYDSTRFDDYENYGFDVTWSHQHNERLAFEVSGYGSEYQASPLPTCRGQIFSLGFSPQVDFGLSDTVRRDARTYGLEFGVRSSINESLEFAVSVGGRDVENERKLQNCVGTRLDFLTLALAPGDQTGSISDSNNGFSGRTSLTYSGKKFRSELEIEQSVSPAGLGFLLDTKTLKAKTTYKLRKHLNVGLQLLVSDSESVSQADDYERDFWTLTGTANWKLGPHWRVLFGARTREQQASFISGTAEAASVFVDLKYLPRQTRVSR